LVGLLSRNNNSTRYAANLQIAQTPDPVITLFRLHFQYLCAFDRPKDYDYFRITAGPQTLAQRFTGRPPSKSRIERATSGYTSLAP